MLSLSGEVRATLRWEPFHFSAPPPCLGCQIRIHPSGWLSWLECCPIHWKVAGSISSEGICLGCGFDTQSGHIQEATDQCFFHVDVSFSLLSPTFLFLKSMNISSGEDLKKQTKKDPCSGCCDSVDWVLTCEPKGRWFDSQSGHMHGLGARSPQ